jgi:hypothetical protein
MMIFLNVQVTSQELHKSDGRYMLFFTCHKIITDCFKQSISILSVQDIETSDIELKEYRV